MANPRRRRALKQLRLQKKQEADLAALAAQTQQIQKEEVIKEEVVLEVIPEQQKTEEVLQSIDETLKELAKEEKEMKKPKLKKKGK